MVPLSTRKTLIATTKSLGKEKYTLSGREREKESLVHLVPGGPSVLTSLTLQYLTEKSEMHGTNSEDQEDRQRKSERQERIKSRREERK